MFSLTLFAIWYVIAAFALAGLMAITARAVGSDRGRWVPALRLVGTLMVMSIAFVIASAALNNAMAADRSARGDPIDDPVLARSIAVQQGTVGIVLGLIQLGASYAIIRRGFRISAGRAFAPFGAYLGGLVAVVVVGLFVIRPYLVEGFVLPTSSMSPTLVSNDHVAANKIGRPHRWDIVVYRDATSQRHPIFCKRIVALPGETLTFDGRGGVTIDGKPIAVPPPAAGRYFAAAGPARSQARYTDGEPIHLSDQQVFLIGDNVDGSYDSRFTGPSEVSSIIGVVDLVYWPPTHVRVLGW